MIKDGNIVLLKSSQIIRMLKKHDISIAKTKNLHHLLVNDKGKRTTIPSKRGSIISPILLARILQDLNIELSDFINGI